MTINIAITSNHFVLLLLTCVFFEEFLGEGISLELPVYYNLSTFRRRYDTLQSCSPTKLLSLNTEVVYPFKIFRFGVEYNIRLALCSAPFHTQEDRCQ